MRVGKTKTREAKKNRVVKTIETANDTFNSMLYSNLERERKRKEELKRQKKERRKLGVEWQ